MLWRSPFLLFECFFRARQKQFQIEYGNSEYSGISSIFESWIIVRPGAPLVAFLLLVAMPFFTGGVLAPSILVVRPGAPLVASLLLVAMPFFTGGVLAPSSKARSAPSSVFAPSSNALCY